MKIIEYNHSLAAKVADMWNKSGSNWGNDAPVRTEKDVIDEESKSGNLKLYLAIDNDEVVGYCSLSEYEYDEGASYLPLLNVRPDYHGKKVGKALILKVLDDAIKAPWPRFDLFTWSGNIKAMPLYKKCGFFWEKNNQSVHLMNFLPYLYQTEAINEHLNNLNWYQDSKRVIDMTQDGTEVNGFDYLRYHFENDQTLLITEFEKSGRGLRYLETQDYTIEMNLPKHKLTYGNTYNVEFKVVNKSGKSLEIKIEGVNNKNIVSDFFETVTVKDTYTVTKQFTVNKIKKTQNIFKTHPVVECNILINNLKSTFKCGIEPKNPVALKLELPQYNHVLDTVYSGYLNMENNLDQDLSLEVILPKKHIEVMNKLEVSLKPKEKRSIEVKYKVKEFGFINDEAEISYNDTIIYSDVKSLVKGHNELFHAEDEFNVYLVDGNYTLRYDKIHNHISFMRKFEDNGPLTFRTPKIGLPYNLEFSNQEAVFTFPKENTLKVSLKSKNFKDTELLIFIESNKGIFNTYYELVNNGEQKELALSIPIRKAFLDTSVPYMGGILETTIKEGAGAASLDDNLIDENWLYDKNTKTGFTWHKDNQISVSGWSFVSAKENITLSKGQSYKTKPFVLSFVHPNVKLFRTFASSFKEKDTLKFLTLNINEGNPFSKGDIPLTLTNLRKKRMEGELVCDGNRVDISSTLPLTPGLKEITLDTKDRLIEYKRLVFKQNGSVDCKEVDNSLVVNNGVLEYKVSNEYSDSVYSLIYNNKEWLDSNYPTPKERMWWGTFVGGINTRFTNVEDQVLLKEDRTASFVTLKDNFSNEWQGIKTVVTFNLDIDLKGYIFENYYITLPGVPVLYSFTNIINNSGTYSRSKFCARYNVLKLDDNNKSGTFEHDATTYKCGNLGIEKELKKLVQFKSTRDDKLSIYNKHNELLADTQEQYTILFSENRLSIPDRENKQFSGDFFIFTKEDIKKDYLIDLENIKFEV